MFLTCQGQSTDTLPAATAARACACKWRRVAVVSIELLTGRHVPSMGLENGGGLVG